MRTCELTGGPSALISASSIELSLRVEDRCEEAVRARRAALVASGRAGRIVGVAVLLSVAACRGSAPTVPGPAAPRGESLLRQQMKAYPETVTGAFVPLVDFEASPGQAGGAEQVALFSVIPLGADTSLRFAANLTRTGAGAMAVTLPPESSLVLSLSGYSDFTGFTLLSLAVHSQAVRDDLTVMLSSDQASWTSARQLIVPGWNNVEIDIERLASAGLLDITQVRRISLFFADAAGPVEFRLDDVLLVDNERDIKPAPVSVTLHKVGLDYRLRLSNVDRPITLGQSSDGLWRLSGRQATMQVAAPGEALPPGGEQIDLMGSRKIGRVELLEHNSVRVRLANTWYFPDRAGEWVSLAVRRIRWEHTIYSDGRWVTCMTLNNAGGGEISSLRLWLDRQAAWSPGAISKDLVVRDFHQPVGTWSYMVPPDGLSAEALCGNYVDPAWIQPIMAGAGPSAQGDWQGDGFDQSQGCYRIKARNGHCRFVIRPPAEGLLDPAFMVEGPWQGPPAVNVQGMAVRNVALLGDGSAIFQVPGWIRQPAMVEVTGQPAAPAGAAAAAMLAEPSSSVDPDGGLGRIIP